MHGNNEITSVYFGDEVEEEVVYANMQSFAFAAVSLLRGTRGSLQRPRGCSVFGSSLSSFSPIEHRGLHADLCEGD